MLVKQIRIDSLIAKPFYRVHRAIINGTHDDIWLKGGRGSSKSSFTALQIILGIMRYPKTNALCLRKVGDTIEKSVFTTLLWAIDMLQVTHLFYIIKKPATITYIPTGQKIYMAGLDDPQKLKSIKARHGYFKYLWFEEASDFNGMDEIRNVTQSVFRGGDSYVKFITYNPPNDPNAWVNKESLYTVDKRLVHASTYLDIPHEWLGDKFIEEAEKLKERDIEKYNHEYMGNAVGRSDRIVFYGKWEVKDFVTPPVHQLYQSRYFYGVDWGFANDPTAITRSFIMDNCLYIDWEAGGVGVEFEQIPALFQKVPEVRKWKIYADNARPETISYTKRQGFNIHSVEKWKGSVEDGVEYIRSFKRIYIHARCPKTAEEFTRYSYKFDEHTQEVLPVIVDDWNHYIDSIRYSLADYIKKNVSGWFV